MVVSLPRHDHQALPPFSLVLPTHLVCLRHLDPGIPPWFLRWQPHCLEPWEWPYADSEAPRLRSVISWCRSRGSCLLSPTVVVLWRLGRKRVRFCSFLVISIPVDPVRCGLSPFACLVFRFHIPWFPLLLWWVNQRKVDPVSLPRLCGSSCLNSCILVPNRPKNFFGFRGDNRTTKNHGDVLVHLVHLGCGTLQVVWALMFFVRHSFLFPISYHGKWIGKSRPLPFSSLLVPPSLGSRQLQWRLDWETGTSHVSLFIPVDLREAWIKGPLAVVFAYDKLGSMPFIKVVQVDTINPESIG